MPDFVNPFSGIVPRQMSDHELARAIMLNISAELEAVHLYLAHMDATTNEDARKVLYDIALEELVHAGEFTSLLYRLDPISGAKAREGFAEVQELLGSVAPFDIAAVGSRENPPPRAEAAPPSAGSLTVGDLKEI